MLFNVAGTICVKLLKLGSGHFKALLSPLGVLTTVGSLDLR
jgi:hypothetical protein